jgi:hypothetical protein
MAWDMLPRSACGNNPNGKLPIHGNAARRNASVVAKANSPGVLFFCTLRGLELPDLEISHLSPAVGTRTP